MKGILIISIWCAFFWILYGWLFGTFVYRNRFGPKSRIEVKRITMYHDNAVKKLCESISKLITIFSSISIWWERNYETKDFIRDQSNQMINISKNSKKEAGIRCVMRHTHHTESNRSVFTTIWKWVAIASTRAPATRGDALSHVSSLETLRHASATE